MHFSNFCEHFEASIVIPFQLRVGRDDKDRDWTRMEGKMIPGPSGPRLTHQGHLSGQYSLHSRYSPRWVTRALKGVPGSGTPCTEHQPLSDLTSHPPSGPLSLLLSNKGCTHDLRLVSSNFHQRQALWGRASQWSRQQATTEEEEAAWQEAG